MGAGAEVTCRVEVTSGAKYRLFASSAGRCQRPDCLTPVFVEIGTKSVRIAELAHIIAASGGGPRRVTIGDDDVSAFDNVIVLCPTCHTIVDKAPDDFPAELLKLWKANHELAIDEAFGAATYASRADARAAVVPRFAENAEIHARYGPDQPAHRQPGSEMVDTWRRKVLERVIPNNRELLRIAAQNRHLLRADELALLEAFRQHADDFETYHVHGEVEPYRSMFPAGIVHLFEE